MTTQQAFKVIYKPQNKAASNIACGEWGEDTWEFKRARSKQLEDLCK